MDVNLEDQNCTDYIPREKWVQKKCDKIVTQRRKVKNYAYI
jgi:hypothetical protein